ncbi:MAG: mannitol/fructose-specific phosphotransferase system IIA component (Ntr-type) [Myxococcota bacterium]
MLAEACEDFDAIDASRLLREIMDRERTMSAIGMGIAIPHAYSRCLSRSQCWLAVVPSALEVPTEIGDGDPVKLVFLVLSPPNAAQVHLESLAAVATIAVDRSLTGLLVESDDGDDALELIALKA